MIAVPGTGQGMSKSVNKPIAEIDAFRDDRVAQAMLQDIALRLIATPEHEYLTGFAEAAGLAMNADMVLVSSISTPHEPVTALALYDRTGQTSSYEYPLKGTPCEQVASGHEPFVASCRLQENFPDDADLQAFGLNSYVGMPLFHNGVCFGLVAAMFCAEDPPSGPILKVFKLVEDKLAAGVRAHAAMTAERLSLRSQVSQSRARLEIALEASGVGVWEFDIVAGKTLWDARMCELYGQPWQDQSVQGEAWLKLIHPEDADQVWTDTLRSVQARQSYTTQFRIIRADGEVRTLRSVGRYVEIEGANPGFIGADRDITDDIALAAKLKQRTRDAEAANVAKSQFLSNASHELRTPLTNILAGLEILQSRNSDAVQEKWLDMTQASGAHLLSIINDFLDMTKLETRSLDIERSRFELSEMLSNAIDLCVGTDPETDLTLDVDPQAPVTLVSDPRRVGQVVINLLANALKFGRGKPITVNLRPSEHDDMAVRIEVRDCGCGIDPAHQQAIFDRLHQVDGDNNRQHGGNGLGLAICRELVTIMGGFIGVDSTPGEGSCFYVELPQLQPDPVAGPEPVSG